MPSRKPLLAQFEPDVAVGLIEFSKLIVDLDVDVLLFMARKAFCLYQALWRTGFPPPQQVVVSDRILDMSLEPLRGKRVALIDDTLILGTTLAKAKRNLDRQLDVKAKVYAFCTDQTWWSRKLIEPNYYQMMLDDKRVMTFCTAEIRVLSITPRPYLVDFPVSRNMRFTKSASSELLSCVEWIPYRTSSALQARHGIETYTFIPADQIIGELWEAGGGALADCLSIVKVRAYTKIENGTARVQFVPIVTLKPLSVQTLDVLFDVCIERISQVANADLRRVKESATTPRAKQRITQYCLSSALGKRFLHSLEDPNHQHASPCYDEGEAAAHYGPWLRSEFVAIGEQAFGALWDPTRRLGQATEKVCAPARVPDSVQQWARKLYPSPLTGNYNSDERVEPLLDVTVNVLPRFIEFFLDSYDKMEVPARKEARRLGNRVLDATPEDVPYRDRLEMGIPWDSFAEYFSAQCGIKPSIDNCNLLSIALDICNDLGIAVPVTCERDGVVFRAYRHGEDVKFADAELVLAYDTCKGFLKSTHGKTIQRLVLEKLLTLLIKVGLANGFMEPIYGTTGFDGVARIGFDLKGSRPLFVGTPRESADRDMWLTEYLGERGVVSIDKENRQYRIAKTRPPEGNQLVHDAPDRAYQLGYILGFLLHGRRGKYLEASPLDEGALTVLATCWPPRHAAQALEAELDIFRRWYEWKGSRIAQSLRWDDSRSVHNHLALLIHSGGHEAVHAAKLKFLGYKRGVPQRIVRMCESYLRRYAPSPLDSRTWRSYWSALRTWEVKGERSKFDPWIRKAACICWESAIYLSAIELCLRYRLIELGTQSRKHLNDSFNKMLEYHKGMSEAGLTAPPSVQKLVSRFQEIRDKDFLEFDYRSAFGYAVGEISKRISEAASVVDSIGRLAHRFGKLQNLKEYSYMVYYDVRDSTGTQAGKNGIDVESYRKEVRSFKEYMSDQVHRMTKEFLRTGNEIFCWNGDKSSTNDAKHVFFRGRDAENGLRQLVGVLASSQQLFAGVSVRIYAIPCDFAGSSAYRYDRDTEIRGERFWEHWSRIRTAAKGLEDSADGGSFLLVATDGLIDSFEQTPQVNWSNAKVEIIRTEIECLARETKVKFGRIATPLRLHFDTELALPS